MLYGLKAFWEENWNKTSLNPYFFGKCSTAITGYKKDPDDDCLNPYFFGKCSTAIIGV